MTALPKADELEEPLKDTAEEPDYENNKEDDKICRVYRSDDEPVPCGKRAVASIMIADDYCKPSLRYFCKEHLAQAIAGQLICLTCREAGRPKVYVYPVAL